MSDRVLRLATALVVIAIGAIAAVISYRHAYDVATSHGESGATAPLIPITIDGLVIVASASLLDAARRRLSAPLLARVALALGIGATVAVNVLHGIAHGIVGAVIAAWPAVTLVLAVELLMGMVRHGRDQGVRSVHPLAEPTEPDADPVVATARERFAETLAADEIPSIRAIRRELRVGHPRAVSVRQALAGEES